jgi:hypothetical protein
MVNFKAKNGQSRMGTVIGAAAGMPHEIFTSRQKCVWRIAGLCLTFAASTTQKKANPDGRPPPCRNCAWDYNGTNSPRKAGLEKDHNL